jgi:TfoX N-terminal domain
MTKAEAPDPRVLAAFDTMIAAVPGVERKGAAMPYTSINGNMYAMVSKAGVIGLRLGKNDLASFMAAGGEPFEGTPGFVNKEYGGVPTAMLSQREALEHWFRTSYAFASGLRPKQTTR